MTTKKQHFPPVTFECLPSGLLRLEDESVADGYAIIDLHPVQVQTLACMIGFSLPDPTRKALGRVLARVQALHRQASDLEKLLGSAVDTGECVAAELTAAEFIAVNLGEVVPDIQDLQAADLEPMADAPANPGGQLVLV